MTADPWSLFPSLSCPACHATGKVVREEDDDNEPPFMCCECGQLWKDDGVCADHWLKEARVAYGRLVEGRPYEAPPPKPHDPDAKHIDASAYDSVLKDYYQRPASGPSIGDLGNRAKVIAESAETYPTSTAGYMLSTERFSELMDVTLGDWIDRAKSLGNWGDDGDPTE
jgi:hypothetical protein